MSKLQYEWDAQKAVTNFRRHEITFDEAKTVFDDPMHIVLVDEEHSRDEERYIAIGLSKTGRLLVVAHTDREERVRIISARKATRKEARFYAEAE